MNREKIIQILSEYAVDLFAHGLRYGYETNTPLLEKIADEIVSSLPPAEGAEAIVKKYEDEYDFKFHWVQRDRVIRMMREFAAQPQPKLDPKKVQWSGYGELGNISQKPPQPTAESAEANRANIDDLIKKHIPIDAANFEYCAKHNIINGGLLQGIRDVVNSFMKQQPTAEGAEEILDKYPHSIEYPSFVHENSAIAAMTEFATLHAQRIAEKMVKERMEQYKAQFKDKPNPLEVNPYDSKGIKRIRNRKIH